MQAIRVTAKYRCGILLVATVATLVFVLLLGARPAEAQETTVVPTVDCVEYDADTNILRAHFGCINTAATVVTVPFDENNYFDPFPDFRNQPTNFQPGTHRRVFSTIVDLDDASEVAWYLFGVPATATNDPSLYCATDVSLSQSATPEPVLAGEELTYTLTATNSGPVRATGVTVTDPLPGGADLVSTDASQGSCSGTETVICNVSALEKDQSARITLVVRPSRAGELVNTASVGAVQPDPNLSNNNATARTAVVAPPSAITGPASDLSQGGATLSAFVDPSGSETTYHFEYGTDATYGWSTPDGSAGSGVGTGLVEATVDGLQPETTYHYRLVATNDHGTQEGSDRTFTTLADAPPPNTAPAITRTSPTSGARIRDRTPTVGANVHDDETDLSRTDMRLWVDGRMVRGFSYDRTRERLSFTPRKPMAMGRHSILIVAVDDGGLSTSRIWRFSIRR